MRDIATFREERIEGLPKKENIRASESTRERRARLERPRHQVKRFLRSQTGKPWDEVVSRFIRTVKLLPQTKALELLESEVETKTFLGPNDSILAHQSQAVYGESTLDVMRDARVSEVFYVHPTTRRLLVADHREHINWAERRRKSEAQWLQRLGPWHQLQKIEGVWYELRLEGMERLNLPKHGPDDVIDATTPFPQVWWSQLKPAPRTRDQVGPAPRFFKRQLGSKEIQKRALPR